MKSSETVFRLFDSKATLHRVLAHHVAQELTEAIAVKGSASLMLSGGNTPRPFLAELAKENVKWDKVKVGLVDERWVDPASDRSNENLVRTELLGRGAEAASFFGMYREGMSVEAACAEVGAVYKKELFPFDVVILGMGGDGHTASLFPHRPELQHLLNDPVICGAAEAPVEPVTRLSLSLYAIASAAHCYLHFEGGEKLAVYEEAVSGGNDVTAMPVRAVLNRPDIALEVYYT